MPADHFDCHLTAAHRLHRLEIDLHVELGRRRDVAFAARRTGDDRRVIRLRGDDDRPEGGRAGSRRGLVIDLRGGLPCQRSGLRISARPIDHNPHPLPSSRVLAVKLSQVLFSQGFGSRRECEGLIFGGHVRLAGGVCTDPFTEVDVDALDLVFGVRGVRWPYRAKALIVLHKPTGHECSQKPKHHPSVMNLLPMPLRVRGLQPVGRLDEDTTGLLLMTDDGALIHRLTSPRKHVAKVYEVGTVDPVGDSQIAALLRGVVLHDDPLPVRAAAAEQTGPHALRLTLLEGKYHQVKRMVAATGNTVATLHRSSYGILPLPADLAPGAWRWLDGVSAVLGSSR